MIQISRVGTKNMLTVLIFTAAPCVTPPCLVVTVQPLPSLPPLAFPGPEPEPETLPPTLTWRQLCVGRGSCTI